MSEYITAYEFARRMKVSASLIYGAISRGRIVQTVMPDGKKKLDWETQSVAYEQGRLKKEPANKISKRNPESLVKVIGDTEVYEMGNMGIDPSNSRYDNIPDINNISAPPGSVAYFQARKIAIDGSRSLLALRQEAGELIAVPDAVSLYCETLSKLSQTIQEIPSKVTNVICANIRKDVAEWKRPPENLEAEVFRLITQRTKAILTDLAEDLAKAEEVTQEFIENNVVGKKSKRKK